MIEILQSVVIVVVMVIGPPALVLGLALREQRLKAIQS